MNCIKILVYKKSSTHRVVDAAIRGVKPLDQKTKPNNSVVMMYIYLFSN